jgi:aryl-phospho-beta-D-glucosidase BglC (GH1 family)
VNVFAIWNDPVRIAADQEDYDRIRAKGFTVVRLVMPWAWFEPEPGRWTNIDLLDQAIANARRAGLYVVLDPFHLHPSLPPPTWASGRDLIEKVQKHGRPWLQFVATRYRDNATVAAYDLFNEPDPVDQNRALAMLDEMIDSLRQVDPDKIAMITPPWGNSSMDPSFVDERLLTHRFNVVHTVHDYYAGNGDASTVSNGYNAAGLPSGNFTWSTGGYPEPNDEADFAAQLAVQTNFAQRADVPMWIGEFGVDLGAPNSSEWVDDKIALYERLGLGRAWWMYKCGGTHAILLPSCEWNALAERLKP